MEKNEKSPCVTDVLTPYTHRVEFYEVEDIALSMEEHNKQLEAWDRTYNTIRPHQSLDYQTPAEYYQAWLKLHPQPTVSLM